MPTYNPVEYWILIPKIIEITMFLTLAIKTYKLRDYIVNKLFGLSFVVWTFYTWGDLFEWTIGANGVTWLAVANVLRDIQLIAAMLFAYLMFLITEIIKDSYEGLNRKKVWSVFIIYAIITVVLISTESLYVTDASDPNKLPIPPEQWDVVDVVEVTSDLSTLTGILMILPVLLYIKSASTLIQISKNSPDKDLKKRMRELIIGISLIPTGLIYFAIALGIGVPLAYQIYVFSIGRSIWVISPIFIWNSQRKRKIGQDKPEENKELKVEQTNR